MVQFLLFHHLYHLNYNQSVEYNHHQFKIKILSFWISINSWKKQLLYLLLCKRLSMNHLDTINNANQLSKTMRVCTLVNLFNHVSSCLSLPIYFTKCIHLLSTNFHIQFIINIDWFFYFSYYKFKFYIWHYYTLDFI